MSGGLCGWVEERVNWVDRNKDGSISQLNCNRCYLTISWGRALKLVKDSITVTNSTNPWILPKNCLD